MLLISLFVCSNFFFFFSSRRRHTRFKCDWSSDVCSSDLRRQAAAFFQTGNNSAASLSGRRGQTRPARTAGVAALRRLFDELGERFKDPPGGYTPIVKLARRPGDTAQLASTHLVKNPHDLHPL